MTTIQRRRVVITGMGTVNPCGNSVAETWEALLAGKNGIRAMLSMSVEKSYRLIPREMSIEYNAYESGLDRFIKPEKQFLGRDGKVDGLQKRVLCRTAERALFIRPMAKGQETDLFHDATS